MKIPLEIKQLGEEIKQSLPDKSIKVIGEVSQPKNFRGNMYLNLRRKWNYIFHNRKTDKT